MGCNESKTPSQDRRQQRPQLPTNTSYQQQIKSDEYKKYQHYLCSLTIQDILNIQQLACYCLGVRYDQVPICFVFVPQHRQFNPHPAPQNMDIRNYSSMVYINESCIFVTGGINQRLDNISKKAYIWDPMHNLSYRIPDILYVFGGRAFGDDNDGPLKKCEYFDFESCKWGWVQLDDMKYRRATPFSIIYGQYIYVFGGYTVLNVKLHRGIECGLAVAGGNNELVLIGGNMQKGPVDNINIYNLNDLTVHNRPSMKNSRVLNKGFQIGNEVFTWGGCEKNCFETMKIHDYNWQEGLAYYSQFTNDTQIKEYSHSQKPCVINQAPNNPYRCNDISENVYLFGTDQEPFVMEFNISNGFVINKPVPLGIRLFAYQGGVSLGNGQFLLIGGVRNFMDKVQASCYLYDAHQEIGIKKAKMKQEAYSFPTLLRFPYVYVFGGRKVGQDQVALLKKCQRYDIQKNQWAFIADMKIPRVSAMANIFNGKIHVWGGYTGHKVRGTEIEVYNSEHNVWEILNFQLPFGIEASSFIQKNQSELIVLGGRDQTGNLSQVWEFSIKDHSKGQKVDGIWNQIGSIGESRCLHKVYQLKQSNWILIFGGNALRPIDIFDLDMKIVGVNDALECVIQNFTEEIRKIQDPYMQRYQLLFDRKLD